LFRRPLVGGLLFVFGWEQLAAILPGYVGQLTIAHYLQADTMSVATLLAMTIAALWLAVRTIERREYLARTVIETVAPCDPYNRRRQGESP
jgi:hypothetical protein